MTSPAASVASPSAKAVAAGQGADAYRVKARGAAENFEAVFLNEMMQHMFTGIGNDGPLGGGPATGVWRSMLTDQYARSIAKAGGIGIANQIYNSLIAVQAGRSS